MEFSRQLESKRSTRVWKLLLVVALIQLVLFPFVDVGAMGMAGTFFIASNLSISSLVAICWAVFRTWKIYLFGFVLLLAIGFLLTRGTARGFEPMVFLLPLLIAIPTSLTLETIGAFYGRFVQTQDLDFLEGLQFRIFHLFLATTVVAVVCGISQALWPYISESFSSVRVLEIIGVIAIVLSFNTLLSVWTFLGRSVAGRVVVSLLLSAGVTAAVYFAMPHFRRHPGTWVGLLVGNGLVTAVALLILRKDGYRFVKSIRH